MSCLSVWLLWGFCLGKYRDKLRIIADVLAIANRRATKTQIMYQANLSYRLLCRYLEEVVNAGLVGSEKGRLYVLTRRGEAFLQKFKEYHKQCKRLEEQIGSVHSGKAELEKMLFNVVIGMDDSRSLVNSRKLKQEEVT